MNKQKIDSIVFSLLTILGLNQLSETLSTKRIDKNHKIERIHISQNDEPESYILAGLLKEKLEKAKKGAKKISLKKSIKKTGSNIKKVSEKTKHNVKKVAEKGKQNLKQISEKQKDNIKILDKRADRFWTKGMRDIRTGNKYDSNEKAEASERENIKIQVLKEEKKRQFELILKDQSFENAEMLKRLNFLQILKLNMEAVLTAFKILKEQNKKLLNANILNSEITETSLLAFKKLSISYLANLSEYKEIYSETMKNCTISILNNNENTISKNLSIENQQTKTEPPTDQNNTRTCKTTEAQTNQELINKDLEIELIEYIESIDHNKAIITDSFSKQQEILSNIVQIEMLIEATKNNIESDIKYTQDYLLSKGIKYEN